MKKQIKNEIKKMCDEASKMLNGFINEETSGLSSKFRGEYQIWYTKAEIIVKQILPDRYDEFINCYNCSKRKEISYDNFSMSDYLKGICITRGGIKIFDEKVAAISKFLIQKDILQSIYDSIDNVLFNIKENLELEVLDNELLSSEKLCKKGYLRSAGAICGVVLERHFKSVMSNHNLKITKKEPCISDYNDLFKNENVYDIVNWRFVQHLGDIRNLCDHNKDREPTKDEVEELINGTDKIIKTIF